MASTTEDSPLRALCCLVWLWMIWVRLADVVAAGAATLTGVPTMWVASAEGTLSMREMEVLPAAFDGEAPAMMSEVGLAAAIGLCAWPKEGKRKSEKRLCSRKRRCWFVLAAGASARMEMGRGGSTVGRAASFLCKCDGEDGWKEG